MKDAIRAYLPILTPKQIEIDEHPAKNKSIIEGRRFGKTTLFSDKAVRTFLGDPKLGIEPGIVIEAAPIAKQTNAFWKYCKLILRPYIDAGIVKKWETDRHLEYGHGFLSTQTAWDSDTFRGGDADLLLLDEYAYMKDDSILEEVGYPMLLDTDGSVWTASTSNKRNHGYKLFMKAKNDPTDEWAAFHGTSWDNPHLSRSALERAKRNMNAGYDYKNGIYSPQYRQEIMAEFLEGEGAVFYNIAACTKAPLQPTPKDHEGHIIVAGVDWGKKQDYTAISIGCWNCHKELLHERFRKVDYHYQRNMLIELGKRWGVNFPLIELNSIGEVNFEELVRDGLPVMGFNTTMQSKIMVIEGLKLALATGEWQFQDDEIWTGELESYEQTINKLGKSSYSAPQGMHDDTVIARALMIHAYDYYLANREQTIVYDDRVNISPV